MHRTRVPCVTPLGVLLVLLLRVPVANAREPGMAEPASEEPPGYVAAIEQGLAEHERGNYEEVRAHLLLAHRLFPNARTLRGLGMVEFELRNYGEATRYLEAALAAEVKPLEGVLRSSTEALLERARVYIGQVRLDVEPAHAEVLVDGLLLASSLERALVLDVGDHLIEFRANGCSSERRSVHIRGGDALSIEIRLQALAPPSAGANAASVAPAAVPAVVQGSSGRHVDARTTRRKRWLWAVGTLAVGAVAVGLGMTLRNDREAPAHETTAPDIPVFTGDSSN